MSIVHDNTNLRVHLKSLEVNEDSLNVPPAEETAIPPVVVRPHALTSALKEKKHAKPPAKLLSLVQSDEGSSSIRSVTSRRHENVKQRPNDVVHHPEATVHLKSNYSSVFRRLGAEARHQEKEPVRSSSNLRALGNNVLVPPLHGSLKENNTQL